MTKARLLFLSLMMFLGGNSILAQESNKPQEAFLAIDRPFYVDGETLRYSLAAFDAQSKTPLVGTKFMELNLVSKEGKAVVGNKVKVISGKGHGQMVLPSQLTPGNYLLVLGYPTEPVENYLSSTLVKIYPSSLDDYSKGVEADVIKDVRSSTSEGSSSNAITINLAKTEYDPRTKVDLSIETNGEDVVANSLSVTITKKYLSKLGNSPIEDQIQKSNTRAERPIRFVDSKNHGALLYSFDLTEGPEETAVSSAYMIEDQQEAMLFKNSEGKYILDASNLDEGEKTFYFNHFYFLPWSDNRYRYVRKRWMNGGELKLDWSKDERDFSSILPEGMGATLKQEATVLRYLTQKQLREQITQSYQSKSQARLITSEDSKYQPSDWYVVNDYSKMLDLAEFMKEVVSGLKLTKEDGVRDFRFSYPGDKYRGRPFILVDGIPTLDVERVLEIPITSIEGVGVLKDLTTDTKIARENRLDLERFGYFGKNGILFIKLNNNVVNPFRTDLNEMPSGELISMGKEFEMPNYGAGGIPVSQPDFRSILLWKPNVILENNRASLSFYTADDSDEYQIIVKGVSKDGIPITISKTFRVQKGQSN